MNALTRNAASWVIGSIVAATVLWVVGGTIHAILDGAPREPGLLWIAVVWGGSFGLITSTAVAVPYAPLLWLWLKKPPRVLGLEDNWRGVVLGTLLLSLPITSLVTASLGGLFNDGFPFDWAFASSVLPWVFLAAWGGLLLPRLVLRRLRPQRLVSDGSA